MTDNRSVIFRFSSLTEQFNAQISEVAVSVCCHARGINTLSESRSGSAWHRPVQERLRVSAQRMSCREKVRAADVQTNPFGRAACRRLAVSLREKERETCERSSRSGQGSSPPSLLCTPAALTGDGSSWNWARAGSVRSLRAVVPSHPSQIHHWLCFQTHGADYPDCTLLTGKNAARAVMP